MKTRVIKLDNIWDQNVVNLRIIELEDKGYELTQVVGNALIFNTVINITGNVNTDDIARRFFEKEAAASVHSTNDFEGSDKEKTKDSLLESVDFTLKQARNIGKDVLYLFVCENLLPYVESHLGDSLLERTWLACNKIRLKVRL